MPTFSVLYKGAVIISRTLLGPYGIDRRVLCVDFTDCENGLGRLQPGDQILEVNGDSLVGVTNERREFSELLANYGSRSSTGSARNSPTLQGTGRTSSSSSSSSLSSEQFNPTSSRDASIGKAGTLLCSNTHDDGIQLVTITKSVGLGVTVTGGCNRPDGPKVYVEDIISGGDCQKDGRLRPGDELVAINKKSLMGVTYEEARSILNKTMFTNEGTITIAFLPGKGSLHSGASFHNGEHSPQSNTGNGYSSCRLKVHVRTPKPQFEDRCPVPFQPPDIFPVELSASAAKTSIQKEVLSIKRKVSLDPHVRLKVDKLELALRYLGLHVTEERRRMLRRSLTNDSQGTVAFGEFVQAARITLPQELEDIGLSHSPMMFFPHEVANLLDTTAFQSPIFSSNTFHEAENLDHLQSEVTELRQEIKKMKALVKEMEKNKKTQEEELQQVTQKATAALAENRTLQDKLHLASAAQHRAHSAEQDYEEVVHLLEAEITDLKTELTGKAQSNSKDLTKEDTRDLQQRLSIASCQLQTSELRCKHLEISNQKLFSFAEKVHKVLTSATLQGPDQGVIKSKFFRRESSLAPPGPERLLATEARQLIEWVCSSNSENATCMKTDGVASQEPTAQNRKASRDKNTPTHAHKNSQLQEILFI
ncbi:hypothetical protein scyTo_0011239 [Scyliorhinus torazame]|uniref:PDZ domain-containing protein n=1 Tax=Scyliorhinus torazame TaxID=75743 RepID=A0A401NJJ3_SCYTO|nr:hypothetical protein [Scyliorhinus torazame]